MSNVVQLRAAGEKMCDRGCQLGCQWHEDQVGFARNTCAKRSIALSVSPSQTHIQPLGVPGTCQVRIEHASTIGESARGETDASALAYRERTMASFGH